MTKLKSAILILFGVFLLSSMGSMGCVNAEDHKDKDELMAVRNGDMVVIGSREPAEKFSQGANDDLKKLWAHTNSGNNFIKSGKYAEAIKEYKEALKYVHYNYDKWVPKKHLIDAYEATGQYDNALIEIRDLKAIAMGEQVMADLKTKEAEIIKKASQAS